MKIHLHLLLLFTPAALGLMVAQCPEGWIARGETEECYRVHSHGSDRSFDDARVYCQARGGDLAYINSTQLKNWLGQLMASSGLTGHDAYMWVGGRLVNGEWKWIELDKVIDPLDVEWDQTGTGDCAAFTLNSKLIKQDCGEKLKFICHRDIKIPMACDMNTGWEDVGDWCYKKSRSTYSWYDSEMDCVMQGGHLVTIENDSEQQLAHDLAVEERDKVWIGYTEEGHAGNFSWVDGSNSNYTRWHDGQPDLSHDGYGGVVVDNDNPSGEWMVELIFNNFHYLCEKPTGSCLPGWEEFGRSCYYFNTETTDYKVWDEAKDTCDGVGARLVVLDTYDEDAFFRSRMPSKQFPIWIGLSRESGNGFNWEDGTSMASKNYTYMSKEDEDEALGQTERRCVTTQEIVDIDGTSQVSSWVPQECHSSYPYACEAEAGASLTLIPPDNKRYCPDGGWERLGDHCYLFSAEEMTWSKAQRYCTNQHTTADLVSILTWAEQDFVNTRQLAQGWIGLNDKTTVDQWEWSDGNKLTIENWEYNEPNSGDESCVEMLYLSGRWNDAFCSEMRAFTCKMPASNSPIGTITTTTAIPDSSACGYDWTENPTTGECYRIELMDMPQRDARLHCQELYYYEGQSKPDLLSIYSQEEQTFIFSLLAAQHLSQNSLWIGMKNDVEINEWLDGTPSRYFNFEDGEPNSFYSEECIEMYTGTGRWNDVSCSERRPFICEKKGRNYVAIQPPTAPDVLCPAGWSHWNNKCYYFSDDSVDWFTAEKNCKDKMGSNLASVTNIDENNFINDYLSDHSSIAWIGLRDDDNGDNWHWTDGSVYDWTYWGYDEPNNGYGEEHCGQMISNDYYYDGKWNDMKCTDSFYYVCKMDVKSCPQNWAYKDGKCYYVSDFEATRNEGEVRCSEINGKSTLVNIHSEEENNYFNGLLLQSSQSCWMGLMYDGNNWTWGDGTSMEYSNWNGGEPNNLDVEFCGEMIDYPNGLENGKWNNLHCGESRAFACELYPTHAVGCEEGWEAFEDYCYWYSDSVYGTHDQARQQCQDMGADLVSIHNNEENDFMYSLQASSYDCAFIGFTDNGHHNLFTWSDGTPVVYTKISSFSYWDLTGDKFCGCINSDYYYLGLWTLLDCTYSHPFLCKKPKEAIPLHPEVTGCNEDDYYYEASCYNFPAPSASWEDAKKDCESRGQQLVALENRFETAYFSAIIGELGVKVWLGLSGTIAGDGSVTFAWSNGEPLSYTYWDKYEPDPNYGTCVAASGERSGFWQVRKCADSFQYVCEYDRTDYTTPPPPTTRPPSDYCIYGWEHRGQSCYKVVQEASMWGEAEEKCVMFGGHLASVKDEGEQILILALPGMDEATNKSSSVWVGLAMNEESGYAWTDGTAVGYLNWEVGQPDSHGGKEDCVSANGKTLKLSDSVCQTHFAYVCEAPTGNMLTTATPPTKPPLHTCNDDPTWYKYDAFCYKFVSSTEEMGLSWWRAHKSCRDEGGELASITTHEENYWIESMIYDKSDRAMWTGGRAKLGTGYEWLDGQPFIYDNWALGEPNDVHNQEDCISMYTNNQGYWNDQNCGLLAGRICKRREGATLPPPKTTPVPDGHCPLGWIHAGTKCVYFINDRYNFTIARQVCQAMGSKMDLASIHSAAEQAYLTAAMVVADKHMWIGMRYEEGFYWTDQSDVTYTNWGSGEPNGGSGKEECVEVSSDTGLWNDISCSDQFGAVCMMTQDPNLPDHHTPNKCPSPYNNYISYNGACYRAINTPQKWEEAEATCAKEGAHLASIITITENSFLWAAGQESGFSSYWLGLRKRLESFEWSDGWPTVYTNWGDNEPDSLHRCVYMNVSNSRWYTEACDHSYTFICKYTNETAPTPDPPVNGYCPDKRWTDLNGGFCYLFSNETRTFDEANRICMQEESQLASIHSAGEMTLVTLHMHKYNEPFWIGLFESNSGERWTDGTSLNYINWQEGEPNSHGEQCTEALTKTGDWNDVECSVSRYYICKRRKIQEATEIPPEPPTSQKPGGGGGGDNSGISGGGIAGIVIAVLFVLCAMGFVGYSFVQKQQKLAKTQGQLISFENTNYNAGNTNRTDDSLGGIQVVNVLDGSDV